jgi:hypothetical protein
VQSSRPLLDDTTSRAGGPASWHAKPTESPPKPVETAKLTETRGVEANSPKTGKEIALASNPDYRPSLDAKWFEPDGSVRWPPNNGVVGVERPVTLAKGTTIDRYGSERGKYASPAGALRRQGSPI